MGPTAYKQPSGLTGGGAYHSVNMSGPLVNGEVVFSHYHGAYGEAHRIPGADHGSIPQTWGFRNYTDSLLEFITR